MKTIKKILKWFVLPLLIIFIGFNVWIYFNQELMTFFPYELEQDHQFDFRNTTFEEGKVYTESDGEISYIKFKAFGERKGLVFHSHGNAGNMQTSAGAYEFWTKNGYDYIIWDYAEFGKSTGDLDEATFLKTAKEVFAKLKEDYDEDEIILQGHSLGTSVTLYLAKKFEVKKVVLLAPFYDIIDMAKLRFPVADWMVSFPLNSSKFIKEVDEPILIFHGNKDETIPIEQGIKLSKLKKDAEFVLIDGQPHSRIEQTFMYQEKVLQFVK